MIEPVSRSFAVMEALSRRPHGTIAALAAETSLPRPTVVRLLQTLVELGYATRVSRDIGYRLTDKVLGLAQGIRFVDHLVDAAAPHMSEFTRNYGWPLYLGTISNRAMTIRHSTAAESPMSFERAALQRRSPILSSALGRAWLAFCSADERRAVLRDIGVRQDAKLGRRLRAHQAGRLCLHDPSALRPPAGDRRRDPPGRAGHGLPVDALHPLGAHGRRSGRALRNTADRAGRCHCHRRGPLGTIERMSRSGEDR